MTVDILSRSNVIEACRRTRKLVDENLVVTDYSSSYMTVQAWPLVTPLYSGIEQALKMLLLVQPDSAFTLEALKSREYGHDLEKLHSELPPEDRTHRTALPGALEPVRVRHRRLEH